MKNPPEGPFTQIVYDMVQIAHTLMIRWIELNTWHVILRVNALKKMGLASDVMIWDCQTKRICLSKCSYDKLTRIKYED